MPPPPPPKKPNQNPLLDFRSIRDDAWYTVGKLIFSKRNGSLTVRFLEFGASDDEKFNIRDFKSLKELDDFVSRFRPACVQIQDEECKNLKRLVYVCALLEESEQDRKFYNGYIESIHRAPHSHKGREEICSCEFVVGWLEGPKAKETEQMRLDRICKIPPGSALSDHVLECFVNMSRAQIDLVSDGNHVPAKKEVLSRVRTRSNCLSQKSSPVSKKPSLAKSEFTSAKSFGRSCKVHTKNKEATLLQKSLQGNNVINVEAIVKDKHLGGISMTPEVHTKNEEATLLKKSLQGNNVMNVEATVKDKNLGGISMTPGVHAKNEEATLLKKSLQGNNVMNVEATVKDKTLGGISMVPEVLNRVDGSNFILIENLEKDLDPLTIMSFLFNHVTIICQAFVFPSLPSDSSTRGIIVVETQERLKKLLEYLHNPNQLIVSSRGRPWVISDANPREGAFGNSWSRVEILQGSELSVVRSGTIEFEKGKHLLEIYTNSAIRVQRIHESVISDEENVLLRYNNTRSRKKLKGAAEHKRINSQ